MSQLQDALLDVLSEIQKSCNACSAAADDGEIDADARDRMQAMADGLALAAQFVTKQLTKKEGRGRVY